MPRCRAYTTDITGKTETQAPEGNKPKPVYLPLNEQLKAMIKVLPPSPAPSMIEMHPHR